MAISHVEEEHQRAVAKLKQETLSEVGSQASTQVARSNFSLATSEPAQHVSELQAEAREEWSQLEGRKKMRMRAEAQRLTELLRDKHVKHEQVVAALRANAEKATSGAARARFEEELHEKETQHARELEELEAKVRRLRTRLSRLCLMLTIARHAPTRRQRKLSP